MKERRITVATDEKTHKAVRIKAAKEGRTIRQVVLGLIKKWLSGKD